MLKIAVASAGLHISFGDGTPYLGALHELDGEHVGLRYAFGIRIGQNQSLAGRRSTQSLTLSSLERSLLCCQLFKAPLLGALCYKKDLSQNSKAFLRQSTSLLFGRFRFLSPLNGFSSLKDISSPKALIMNKNWEWKWPRQ